MTSKSFTHTDFEQYLSEEKLMGSKCTACGAIYLPPRPMCTACFGDEMDWLEMDGVGVLEAFTSVYIASTAMIEAGYGRENPHCSGIVRLENGQRISAQILGVNPTEPESILIGSQVKVEFINRDEEQPEKKVLAFRVI